MSLNLVSAKTIVCSKDYNWWKCDLHKAKQVFWFILITWVYLLSVILVTVKCSYFDRWIYSNSIIISRLEVFELANEPVSWCTCNFILIENVFLFHFPLVSLFISSLSLESGQVGDKANVSIQNHEFYTGYKSYLNLLVWIQKVNIADKAFLVLLLHQRIH